MIVSDLFMTLICVCLFVRPLIQLIKTSGSNAESNLSLLYVSKKYVALVSFSLVTTCVALCGVALRPKEPIVGTMAMLCLDFDAIINSFCVMLMFAKHDSLYRNLCCCYKCHDTCHNINQAQEQVAMEVAMSSPTSTSFNFPATSTN